MNPGILAAITGAVAAYIQDEESAHNASRDELNFWRLSGRMAQMNRRINAWQAMSQRGNDAWKYYGLERLMAAQTG
jgi:hypothetical protein